MCMKVRGQVVGNCCLHYVVPGDQTLIVKLVTTTFKFSHLFGPRMEVFKVINNFWLILHYRKSAWLILRPDYLPLSISQSNIVIKVFRNS